ncbi:MAG: sialidase [Verrucomicrobia bacterium]|nr:sialidase [Verrucomicrobiota bacterium]
MNALPSLCRTIATLFCCLPLLRTLAAPATTASTPGLIRSESIASPFPVPFNHASTLVETKEGLLAAWAGGLQERATDVSIWVSRFENNAWSRPQEIADGRQIGHAWRYPCWNPVLFQSKSGPLTLYYRVGPSPSDWRTLYLTSTNGGLTWSAPKSLGRGLVGPVRNKPIELESGVLLAGASREDSGWRVHVERWKSPKSSWSPTPEISGAFEFGAIQPTLLAHRSGRIQMLCRTKYGRVVESWSENEGVSWSRLRLTPLPNPNSALDAVMLIEGAALLVYNHSATERNALNIALSQDGATWQAALVLAREPGHECSYPAVIQTSDGLVHVTYSYDRKEIRHAILDPWQCKLRPMPNGVWPW